MAKTKTKQKRIQRTIQYWRLTGTEAGAQVGEQDWYLLLKAIYGKVITHQVIEKVITGKVFAMQPTTQVADLMKGLLEPNYLGSYDDAVYAVVLSTDKDHVPNQRSRTSGDQKPMKTEPDHVPVDNTFVWFLPMGNFVAVLQENQSAIRAEYICGWLDRVMRDEGLLPQHNFHWDVAPVIDPSTRKALNAARGLRSAKLGATIPAGDQSGLRALLGGDSNYEGEFEIEIKVRHVRKRNPSHYEEDTRKTLEWFETTFGKYGDSLSRATVVLDGPARRAGELNMIRHRMTRKTHVEIDDKKRSINSSSAMGVIMNGFVTDSSPLSELRKL